MKFEKLGNITKNLDNRRKPLNSEERHLKSIDGVYPYIGANNIVGYINEYIFDEKILCVAEDGGSWGYQENCAVIYEGKTWVNNHAHVLVENGKANLDYIKFYLNEANLNKHITGTTRGKLTKSALENIKIPLPENLADQIRIAEVLMKTETLIKQRKKSIDLLDDFLRSTFLDMFIYNPEIKKWTFTEVKNTVEKFKNAIKAGPFGSSLKKEFYVEKGYKIYGQEQVIKDDLNYGNYYINEKLYKKLESCKIKEGDVLISLVGTYGKIIVVPKEFQQGIINPRLMKISFDKKVINPVYFKFFFKSEYLLRQLSKLSRGGTMDIINVGIVKEIKISIPPIKLQNKFASIVEKAEKVKEQYKESLKELENLFGSLSQKAFKGELDLSKLDVSAQIREIEKKIEAENNLDISLQSKLTKPMQQLIKQTENISKILPKNLDSILATQKYAEIALQVSKIDEMMNPFKGIPDLPESVIQSIKRANELKSIASQLNKESKKPNKLTWEEVNFSQVAQWINSTYKEYNFNIEMLFNFLVDEHVTFPNYYSSEELKTNPKLVESDDLKSFIFSALNNENQFIKLEQFFYDAIKENVPLKLREEDYEQIKDKEKGLRSGIYFKVVE
ncbi:restriction endonuclease subunit S [Flavobacterium sp. HNIBRBA15423]|uniref:restriction endonuclease subunit S n=1 Tax=Flavobacterium sp. HNIBRBA15423 TaxID=3458683 RepID=UPI0040440C57